MCLQRLWPKQCQPPPPAAPVPRHEWRNCAKSVSGGSKFFRMDYMRFGFDSISDSTGSKTGKTGKKYTDSRWLLEADTGGSYSNLWLIFEWEWGHHFLVTSADIFDDAVIFWMVHWHNVCHLAEWMSRQTDVSVDFCQDGFTLTAGNESHVINNF